MWAMTDDPEVVTERDVHPVSRGIDSDRLEEWDLDETEPDPDSEPDPDDVLVTCPHCGDRTVHWNAEVLPSTGTRPFPRAGDSFDERIKLPCGQVMARKHTYTSHSGWIKHHWRSE